MIELLKIMIWKRRGRKRLWPVLSYQIFVELLRRTVKNISCLLFAHISNVFISIRWPLANLNSWRMRQHIYIYIYRERERERERESAVQIDEGADCDVLKCEVFISRYLKKIISKRTVSERASTPYLYSGGTWFDSKTATEYTQWVLQGQFYLFIYL
jgi:hypothetical protein